MECWKFYFIDIGEISSDSMTRTHLEQQDRAVEEEHVPYTEKTFRIENRSEGRKKPLQGNQTKLDVVLYQETVNLR